MRLSDLTKDISNMSEEELKAHVQQIRHNKYVAKPAVKKREADVEKKEKNKGIRTLGDMLAGLSEEEKAKLIKQLEEGNG